MCLDLMSGLRDLGADPDAAIQGFAGDTAFYFHFLSRFLDDGTMSEVRSALAEEEWDGMLRAVHNLKGVAGSLGLIPLCDAGAEIVEALRAADVDAARRAMIGLENVYTAICSILSKAKIEGIL